MIEVGKSQTEDIVMQIKSIGIDLGKTTFKGPGRSQRRAALSLTKNRDCTNNPECLPFRELDPASWPK
jgi:hypothetical protein